MTTQHPEALRLAAELDDGYPLTGDAISAAAELRRQHARITELESQLAAIGAGGVEPLRKVGEPLIRFCPGCGSLGKVDPKYRDCCPDGSSARAIPAQLAVKCHDLFRLALDVASGQQPAVTAGWTKASEQLPPCRDDQDYIGINTAGFAGIFNAVRLIDGNTYCLMETAEESVSIMSDLDIWKPFIRPPIPAAPGPADGESNELC